MEFLVWFALAFAVGGALLAAAVLADRRARRRASGIGEAAPERGHPEVDRQVPAYVTQDEVDALPAPGRGVPGNSPTRTRGSASGMPIP